MFNSARVIQGSKRNDIIGKYIRFTYLLLLGSVILFSFMFLIVALIEKNILFLLFWGFVFIVGIVFAFQLIVKKKKSIRN